MTEKKRSKRIELSENCIKKISKKAIDDETVFKLLVEKMLEDFASKLK